MSARPVGEPRWRVLCADGSERLGERFSTEPDALWWTERLDGIPSHCGPHRVERIPEGDDQ